jgi:hypothetical protein
MTVPRAHIALLKRIFYLAYQASSVVGKGILQEQHGATEEDVWQNILTAGDYPGNHHLRRQEQGMYDADYVFGRMMKLYIKVTDDGIELPDKEPKRMYQAWCVTYPTYQALLDAAKASLE